MELETLRERTSEDIPKRGGERRRERRREKEREERDDKVCMA